MIQKFSFDLTSAGKAIGEGELVFGYFSSEAMATQVGLDGGKTSHPWLHLNASANGTWLNLAQLSQDNPLRPGLRLGGGHMNFIDQAYIDCSGGRYGKGYVYASRQLDPRDWFYPCHFYQDPVMPGSLGVEAMAQALQSYVLGCGLGNETNSPVFVPGSGGAAAHWRYRGQIVAANRQMELEVHLVSVERTSAGLLVSGDASLWADGLRIYEVKNLAVGLIEERVQEWNQP